MPDILITILIVLFLQIIFRRLDKNNLRLNKVRQYVERNLQRLAREERERTDRIRTHETELNEMINRAETLNKTLNAKLDMLLEKQEKIRKAEDSILETEILVGKLLSEVGKAQSQMDEIQQNSKRLKETDQNLKKLSKRADEVFNDFRSTEKNILQELSGRQKESAENFSRKVDALKAQILLTENKLTEKLNNENLTLMTIIKRIKDTFSFAEKNIYDQLEKLKSQVKTAYAGLDQALSEKETQALQDSMEKIQRLNDVVKSIETTHINNKNLLIENFKNNLKGLDKNLEEKTSKFEHYLFGLKKDSDARLVKLQGFIREIEMDYQTRDKKSKEEIGNSVKQAQIAMARTRSGLEEYQKESMKSITQKISDLLTRVEKKEGELVEHSRTKLVEFTKKIESSVGRYDTEKQNIQKIINSKIGELNSKSSHYLKIVDQAEKKSESAIQSIIRTTAERLKSIEKQSTELNLSNGKEIHDRLAREMDIRLDSAGATLEKNINLLQDTAKGIESRMGHERDKILEQITGHVNRMKDQTKGFQKHIEDLENKTRMNDEALKKEQSAQKIGLQKNFKEFEAHISEDINRDIAEFKNELNLVLDRYKNSESELLNETRLKIVALESMLSEAEDKMKNAEKNQEQKLLNNYEKFGAALSEKARAIENKLLEKEKGIIQKGHTGLNKVNEQIRKLEKVLKEKETKALRSFKKSMDGFQGTFKKMKEKMDHSTFALVDTHKKQSEQIRKETGLRLKHADTQLTKALADFSGQAREKTESFNHELFKLQTGAQAQIETLIRDVETRLADMNREYTELKDNAGRLEKNFYDKIRSHVEIFNNSVSDKIKNFTTQLKITEKSNSELTREFIQRLNREFDKAKKEVLGRSSELLSHEVEKIDDLNARVDEIRKVIDYFLTKTKLFENADKLKNQLSEQIKKYEQNIKRLKTESKDITKIEAKADKLKRYNDSLNTQITRIMNEKKKIGSMEKNLSGLFKDFEEMENKLQFFKKEKDQIGELNDRFKKLDTLTRKVNNNLDVFRGRESDISQHLTSLDKITSGFSRLEKNVDMSAAKVDKIDDKTLKLNHNLSELEKKSLALGAAEARLNQLTERVEDIEPLLKFVDEKTKQVQKQKDFLLTAEQNIKSYVAQADEKVSDMEELVSQVNMVLNGFKGSSRKKGNAPASSEAPQESLPVSTSGMNQAAIVTKLYNQGWNIKQIEKVTKLPEDQIKNIIRRNL